jgi:hypothetical protein
MPQKFVVDRNGLRNHIEDNNPLKPDLEEVTRLRKLARGNLAFDRQALLKQIEEEEQRCNV